MAAWKPGELILGEYAVERELGRGGMGAVFLVKSNLTGRRFAVKKALLQDEDSRKMFLAELQTWIDLPEHPHIVACRFFRTIDDEIAIFADYLEGGSLADWIRKGKLKSLEAILDVAIQFAWGLHAIHEHGLVHQDVKPGNVLMTADGIVKVSDFGLARARQRAGAGKFVSPENTGTTQSVAAHAGIMTGPYASPEQIEGKPLSRKTDVWSWGVSVLDMFMGKPSCRNGGHFAAEVLEDFLKTGQMEIGKIEMPSVVAGVLAQCFVRDPTVRVMKLDLIAKTLIDYLEYCSGRKYERTAPQGIAPASQCDHFDRRHRGTYWEDPREWLRKAMVAVGGNPTEADAYQSSAVFTRMGAGVADLAVYEEAERLFQQAIEFGNNDAYAALAALYEDKAILCNSLNDTAGTIRAFDQCIAIRKRLVELDGRRDLMNDLAGVLMNKATIMQATCDLKGAAGLYEWSITILRQLVREGCQWEIENNLASAMTKKAMTFVDLGDLKGAVALYDQSIVIYKRLVDQEDRVDLEHNLARTLISKADAIRIQGELNSAVALYEQSILIFKQLVALKGHSEFANELAAALGNKASAVCDLGKPQEAITLFDQCIAILRRMVEQEGHPEFENDLAAALMNKATALRTLGDLGGAADFYSQCIVIRQRLVEQEGRRELMDVLASAMMNKASVVVEMGDVNSAVALYDQCISIRQWLVAQEGRHELLGDLAWVELSRASCFIQQGNMSDAEISRARKALAILGAEVRRTGRADLASIYQAAQQVLQSIL